MTAKRSRPDPKVEAATRKQELGGSERNSHQKYTPWGIWFASAGNRTFTPAGVM